MPKRKEKTQKKFVKINLILFPIELDFVQNPHIYLMWVIRFPLEI